jgi:hypothetical protein
MRPYYVGGADMLVLRGSITLSPALIAQGTTAEQTFSCPGLRPGDCVMVTKPTAQAGLGIVGARCSTADNIGILFANVPSAGGNITPTASEVYQVTALRFDTQL